MEGGSCRGSAVHAAASIDYCREWRRLGNGTRFVHGLPRPELILLPEGDALALVPRGCAPEVLQQHYGDLLWEWAYLRYGVAAGREEMRQLLRWLRAA